MSQWLNEIFLSYSLLHDVILVNLYDTLGQATTWITGQVGWRWKIIWKEIVSRKCCAWYQKNVCCTSDNQEMKKTLKGKSHTLSAAELRACVSCVTRSNQCNFLKACAFTSKIENPFSLSLCHMTETLFFQCNVQLLPWKKYWCSIVGVA